MKSVNIEVYIDIKIYLKPVTGYNESIITGRAEAKDQNRLLRRGQVDRDEDYLCRDYSDAQVREGA